MYIYTKNPPKKEDFVYFHLLDPATDHRLNAGPGARAAADGTVFMKGEWDFE